MEQGSKSTDPVSEFDVRLAILRDKDLFRPFVIEATCSLREAFSQKKVREETALLVGEHKGEVTALLTHQMGYHHVARGELGGEPWLASF